MTEANEQLIRVRNKTLNNRTEILADHQNKCDECGVKENLEIHHRQYKEFDIFDVDVLCSKCHGMEHRNKEKMMPGTNINIVISKELHDEIRILAIRKNKMIRELLPELIQGGLDNVK